MLKQIFIWGLRRSGNHALGDFIGAHNHKNLPQNLLSGDSREQHLKFRKYKIFLNNYLSDYNYRKFMKSHQYPTMKKRLPTPLPEFGNFQIITYEDPNIYERRNDHYFQHTTIVDDPMKTIVDTKRDSEKFAFVILRDPFNWYASWIKTFKTDPKILDVWITFAEKLFLNKDPKWPYMPIKYNKFCLNKKYRKRISRYMNEPFDDNGITRVGSKGSSFDRRRYDGQADKMKTNQRYKYLRPIDIEEIKKRPKLFELSEKIFNFVPEL